MAGLGQQNRVVAVQDLVDPVGVRAVSQHMISSAPARSLRGGSLGRDLFDEHTGLLTHVTAHTAPRCNLAGARWGCIA